MNDQLRTRAIGSAVGVCLSVALLASASIAPGTNLFLRRPYPFTMCTIAALLAIALYFAPVLTVRVVFTLAGVSWGALLGIQATSTDSWASILATGPVRLFVLWSSFAAPVIAAVLASEPTRSPGAVQRVASLWIAAIWATLLIVAAKFAAVAVDVSPPPGLTYERRLIVGAICAVFPFGVLAARWIERAGKNRNAASNDEKQFAARLDAV